MKNVKKTHILIFIFIKLISNNDFIEYINILKNKNILNMIIFNKIYIAILN